MRRCTRALLLMFVALLYAASANAYVISATGPTTASSSDIITVELMLDSEGVGFYGFGVYVDFDPAVLSPVSAGSGYNPIAGMVYGSLYMYPDSWYTGQSNLAAPVAPINASVATLVFHVVDGIPGSSVDTIIAPNFDYGGFGTFADDTATNVAGSVGLTNLTIHVPEPTTTMLMGLGLLGILYAGRRR